MTKLKIVKDRIIPILIRILKELLHILKKIRVPVCLVGFFIFLAGAGGAGDLDMPVWPDILVPLILAFVCINLCILWQGDSRLPEEILATTLKDDDTGTGGIAYEGETLSDFMESLQIPFCTPIEEVNDYLEECGIQRIESDLQESEGSVFGGKIRKEKNDYLY